MIIDKDNIKILLIILVVGLGLGYAYINSDLNINGTAQINSANWDVHWANLQVTNGSVSAPTPTIDTAKTTVTYSATLNQPGDFYEITVDAVNAGSIDAMIDTLSFKVNGVSVITSPMPDYIDYGATYFDYTPLQINQELKADTSEKYRIWIRYKDSIDASQLPTTDQTFNTEFTITYRQATTDAIPVRTYLYSTHTQILELYDSPSSSAYTTSQELIDNTGKTVFLRHRILEDEEFQINEIVESSVGFVYNNNIYYLHGGATDFASTSPYYETNKALLQSIFGSANCVEISDGLPGSTINYSYSCMDNKYTVSKNGYVYVQMNDDWNCYIRDNGDNSCSTGDAA